MPEMVILTADGKEMIMTRKRAEALMRLNPERFRIVSKPCYIKQMRDYKNKMITEVDDK